MRKGDRVYNAATQQFGVVNDPSYEWRGSTTVLVELPNEEWMIPWKPTDCRWVSPYVPTDDDTMDGETSWPTAGI